MSQGGEARDPRDPAARWSAVSASLDALLDLDDDARARALAAMRAEDPARAAEVAALLARLPALEAEGFLEAGALPPPTGEAGRVVGAYTLERELGRGGMGEVWLARRTDGRYEGLVAIKFLQSGLLARDDGERFAREGTMLARLSHPHIARLLDAGLTDEGRPYLVLEYVDGVPIDRHCTEHGLGMAERLALLLDAMGAVAHAHTRLILHRDLKPSNLLVDRTGQVKLLDFGIAKLLDAATGAAGATEVTQRAGAAFTPLYAAPEQLQGGDVTTATDVYALGVLAYRLLADAHPIEGAATGTTLDRLRAVVEQVPRRLSETVARSGAPGAARRARELRGDLDTIVAKALKKVPAERYPNAAAFADDMRRVLQHEPVSARPDGAGYRVAKFVRRHRAGVAAAAVATAALATGVTVALVQAREARAQRAGAESLVEFMVGDLRKRLQPVGRLDALDAVGAKVLSYYAAQDASALDADALGRRARALHLIGEIADQRGQLEEAARRFAQAAATTGELLARHPTDPQRVYDHAQSEYWVGYIARELGRPDEARAGFERYLALAERLVRLAPDNAEWRLEVPYAQENLGLVLMEAGRLDESLAHFELSRQGLEAERARPEAVGELPNLWGWIARAREERGDLAPSLEALRAKRAMLAAQPDYASDREAQYLDANALHEMARLQRMLGDAAGAEASDREGLARMRTIAARDTANLAWQSELALAQLGLAKSLAARGDLAGARPLVDEASGIADRLVKANAQKANWNVFLRGEVLAERARLEAVDALPATRAATTAALAAYLASAHALHADTPSAPSNQERTVALVALTLGDREAAPGGAGVAAARAHWADAARMAGDPRFVTNPSVRVIRAAALARLGDAAGAREEMARLAAAGYRGPLLEDARGRVGTRR